MRILLTEQTESWVLARPTKSKYGHWTDRKDQKRV